MTYLLKLQLIILNINMCVNRPTVACLARRSIIVLLCTVCVAELLSVSIPWKMSVENDIYR